MVSIAELRKIRLMNRLTDKMLEKVIPLIKVSTYQEKETIFEQGQKADTFYMLYRGKVLLNVAVSDAITISLGSVKPGYSFGWSALRPDGVYTSSAVAAEASEVFSVDGKEFLRLLDEDHSMGYLVMQGVVHILENRLERRTTQFLKALAKHIDLEGILS